MTPSPSSPYANPVVRPFSRFIVLLGDDQGNTPTIDDEVDFLTPLRVSVSAGGSRIDTITLRYELAKTGERIQDTAVPLENKRQIQIRRLGEDLQPTTVIAWGFLAAQDLVIDKSQESVIVTARLDKFAFGRALTTVPYNDPDNPGVAIDAERTWIFNPRIDAIVEGNRSAEQLTDAEDNERCHLFLDPESVRTAFSLQRQGAFAAHKWTVIEAILTLCWHLNPDEEFIKNPTRDELEALLPDFVDDEELLRGHALPTGGYLPQCLDDLLAPYGLGWYLVHRLNDAHERESVIRFYRRGEGDLVSLWLQRVAEYLNHELTNLQNISISYNIVELANKITILGHVLQREITARLHPAWGVGSGLDIYQLERGQPGAEEHPWEGRKYVWDEAADYQDLFEPDLTEIFDPPLLIRRRRFLPCISRRPTGDDENSYGVLLEFWDPDKEGAAAFDDTPGWEPEPNDPGWSRYEGQFAVLEKECGILFEGAKPPERIWQLQTDDMLFLRVTATIEGDERLKFTAARRDTSPNGRDLELVLDLGHKFFDRRLQTTGEFQSVLLNHPLAGTPDEKDDTTRIQEYAESLQENEDCAEVSVSVVLDGADHAEYEISKLIEKVDGCELILDANAPTQGEPRRLQIVGWNLQLDGGQRMELLLETFAMERADFTELFDLKQVKG